jgi:Uma2 family endonuclease
VTNREAMARRRVSSDVDDFMATAPEEVLERFECVNGRWREREVTTFAHQEATRRLTTRFEELGYEACHQLRVILSDDDWLAPDVTVISATNPVQPPPGVYEGVPDLVVEVLAADNDHGEDLDKKLRYAAAGVRYYWLVRLRSRVVETYRLEQGGYRALFDPGADGPVSLEPLEALPVPDDL